VDTSTLLNDLNGFINQPVAGRDCGGITKGDVIYLALDKCFQDVGSMVCSPDFPGVCSDF